ADTFPPAKRGMAFAVYGIAVVMAPAIGPTLGGWITDNYTWRWIFFLNIPVGILSLTLTSRLIQDPPFLRRRKLSELKVDYTGLGLIAVGLGALQVVLDKGQRDDWLESNFILFLSLISARRPDLPGALGMAPEGPGSGSSPLPGANVCLRQRPDVHARLCATREHAAVAL